MPVRSRQAVLRPARKVAPVHRAVPLREHRPTVAQVALAPLAPVAMEQMARVMTLRSVPAEVGAVEAGAVLPRADAVRHAEESLHASLSLPECAKASFRPSQRT